MSDWNRLHKRCTWINGNVFPDTPIDKEAIDALGTLDIQRAFHILKQLEEKGEQVKNPSGFLKAAVGREMPDVTSFTSGVDPSTYTRVRKRCMWLNHNVYQQHMAINDEAVAALSSLDFQRAMELCKELEQKGDSVKSPSGYIKAAVTREGGGMMSAGMMSGKGAGKGGYVPVEFDSGVHKRCTWLNANVLAGKEINQEAIFALSMVGWQRAMELCKEVEEKSDEVNNPSRYITAAVTRDMSNGGSHKSSKPDVKTRVAKRVAWLNENVFTANGIDDAAVAALVTLGFQKAMELCKDLEEKGPKKVANPSAFLKGAVRREGQGGAISPAIAKKSRKGP